MGMSESQGQKHYFSLSKSSLGRLMTRERLTHFNVQMENIKCLIHKASSQKPDFGNFLQASSQQVIKLLTSSQAFVNWLARN